MTKEELYIEDSSGALQIVDLPKGQVAINFQQINLLKLESFYSNYSQAIKLPKTSHNSRVFGYSDVFDIDSAFPSKKSRCRYYVNGVDVLGRAAIFVLSSISESFEGSIIMETVDIFALMSDTKVADMDFGLSLARSTNSIAVQDSYDWYKYAFAYFESRYQNFYEHMTVQYMLPFLRLSSVVGLMVSKFGYTLRYEGGKDYYFPISPKRKQHKDANGDERNPEYSWSLTRRIKTVGSDSYGWEVAVNLPNSLENSLKCLYTGSTFDSGYIYVYDDTYYSYKYYEHGLYLTIKLDVPAKVKVNMKLVATGFSYTNGDQYCRQPHIAIAKKSNVASGGIFSYESLLNSSIDVITAAPSANNVTLTIEATREFEVERNEEYVIFAVTPIQRYGNYANKSGIPAVFEGTVQILPSFDEDEASAGEQIAVEKSMPFDACSDLLKLYREAMGGLLRVDEKAKTIAIVDVQSVLDFSRALDWSRKLDNKKPQNVLFKTDFGQNNYIRLKENSETKAADVVNFRLANENANREHDVMTIGAEATDEKTFTAGRSSYATASLVAYDFTNDDSGAESVAKNDLGLRLVRLVDNEFGGYVNGTSSVDGGTYLSMMAKRVSLAEMTADTYKPLFDSMFSKLRVVEATFMLDEFDVASFDQLVPVYVEKFGAHFFVNKIANWVAGKPCKVELIKLSV